MLYDDHIRKSFHLNILSKAHLHADTLVVDELGIKNGQFRADIAVLNGKMEGFEIKGEHDTLERLPSQVEAYNSVFEKITLITCEKYLTKSLDTIPDWWGIYLASSKKEKVVFKRLRTAKKNKQIDYYSVAQLLWRDEALSVLNSIGVVSGLSKKSREDLYRLIVDTMPPKAVISSVLGKIKCRSQWPRDRLPLQ